jgi:hypothetical protein
MKAKIRSVVVTGLALAGLMLSTLALVTCDSTNVLAMITTEVKKANNKLLVVTGLVSPASTANVNPGIAITLEFDRPVDTNTVTTSTISVTPTDGSAVDFSIAVSFSNGNKTVTLEPNPFLKDNTSYDIVLSKDVLAEDGSELEKAMSWSFKTGVYPAGNLLITDASGNDIAYTMYEKGLYAKMIYKAVVDQYRLGTSPTDFANFTDPDAGWLNPPGSSGSIKQLPLDFALPIGDGTKTVYIQFLRKNPFDMSTVRSDTIILDQTPPAVEAGPDLWVSTNTAVPSATASDANGIVSYAWSGDGITYSPAANILAPTLLNPTTDGPYTAKLEVTDVAGNVGTDTATLTRDTVAPNFAPLFSGTLPSGYLMDPAPQWSWIGQANNINGGESPKQFNFALYYCVSMKGSWRAYLTKSKVVDTQYRPVFNPPESRGLFSLKYHNTLYEPIEYYLSVSETDRVGNLSPAATTEKTQLFVTTVLPYNRQEFVTITPTLSWRTMYDSARGTPEAKAYRVYFGEYAGPGMPFIPLDWNEKLTPAIGEIQTWTPNSKSIRLGTTYAWYVVAGSLGTRCPESVIDKEDFWTFTTTTK